MSTKTFKRYIIINNCKHYFLNERGEKDIYFIHSNFLVEEDYMINHPLGRIYKPKGCIDTLIRFVRQPNNSTFMFRVNEWNIPSNPFFITNPVYASRSLSSVFRENDKYFKNLKK